MYGCVRSKKAPVITGAKDVDGLGEVELARPRGVAKSAGVAHFDKLGATLHSKDKFA